ncbi:MAG: cyclic pyranopterin monophosphate synthase MoaC [Anaerorhabdus sp.]
MGLSHFDKKGNAIMVDVTDKNISKREAIACGTIIVNDDILDHIKNKSVKKGDVLNVARIAGIMAVKKTSDTIPMCHPLMITHSSIEFEILEETSSIKAVCTVATDGKTGVEMEALNGTLAALLTIFDMCKAIDKNMCISDCYVLKKTGGKSGEFIHSRKT